LKPGRKNKYNDQAKASKSMSEPNPEKFFYTGNNTQNGPVSLAELKGLASCGKLTRTDKIWKKGMPSWEPASGIAEIFEDLPPDLNALRPDSVGAMPPPLLIGTALLFKRFAAGLGTGVLLGVLFSLAWNHWQQERKARAGDWFCKGVHLGSLGQDVEAIECFTMGLAIDPESTSVWVDKADVLDNRGYRTKQTNDFEAAIECCDRAMAIDPGFSEAWRSKAFALHALNRHKEAIAFDDRYANAPIIDSRSAVAWFDKASQFNTLGDRTKATNDYEAAIGYCDKSLAIDARFSKAWNSKAYALGQLGRSQEAIACYDKDLEIEPQSWGAWNNKSIELKKLGRREEAIQCYDKMLEISPGNTTPWSTMPWYNRGTAEEELGRPSEAIRSYRKFLELTADGGYYDKVKETARKRLNELEGSGGH
jgi:tetratricopeptide (TPR) repeat protein